MQILFTGLLKLIYYVVLTKCIIVLAVACIFLWRDYNEFVPYWDIVTIICKVFLTGLIIFLDPGEGSTKDARIIIATVVSSVCLSVLLLVCIFKRQDDSQLVIISNILLICILSLGIVIQLCDDDDDICEKAIEFLFNSFTVTLIIVVMTVAMLVITMIYFIIMATNDIIAPTIFLAVTSYGPSLEMIEETTHRAFFCMFRNLAKRKVIQLCTGSSFTSQG